LKKGEIGKGLTKKKEKKKKYKVKKRKNPRGGLLSVRGDPLWEQ